MVRTQTKLFGHVGHHIGLADGLPAGNRQRLVGVGDFRKVCVDEMFARHLIHSPQYRLLGNATPTQREQEFHVVVVLLLLRR